MKKNGFTLVEAIIGLAILATLAALSPLIMNVINPPSTSEMKMEEIESFFQGIGRLIRESSFVEVKKDQLVLHTEEQQEFEFSFYENKIRKQQKGLGHEIWLMGVRRFSPAFSNNTVKLSITDQQGRTYTRLFRRMVSK
ncbi:ComG operon protein 6 [Fictibacillus macauensis ZFHKF-1]|uniref:ComG operon protein 6 n=1 Tax=Fictibacillus macauensis ZFHKF-1 TaxID=1196324 RepID=I8AFV5_9BACL|nr:ComGF family competence protein [Fictibacillus macauensis]EIT84492.1 ComG operon protein 6 [Fictibacillus macauensis ZFHKF-1]